MENNSLIIEIASLIGEDPRFKNELICTEVVYSNNSNLSVQIHKLSKLQIHVHIVLLFVEHQTHLLTLVMLEDTQLLLFSI